MNVCRKKHMKITKPLEAFDHFESPAKNLASRSPSIKKQKHAFTIVIYSIFIKSGFQVFSKNMFFNVGVFRSASQNHKIIFVKLLFARGELSKNKFFTKLEKMSLYENEHTSK